MPSLSFKGKALVQNYHLLVPHYELKDVHAKSLTKKVSLSDNVLIHGDNLKALKSLLPYYPAKVNCIYLDPPYNTGNIKKEGWRYNDNVDSAMHQEWLGKVVSVEDLTRHDKWLCMMWPRLRIMRDLLTEDGVILVSIDDNEAHHLRMAMDEIFGPENFIAQLVWEKGRKNDAKLFSTGHEYLLVYARSLAHLRSRDTIWRETRPGAKELWEKYEELRKKHGDRFAAIEEELKEWFKELPKDHPAKGLSRFKQVDKWGPWRDRDISWPGGGGPDYDVIHPKTKKPCEVPEAGWRYPTWEAMKKKIDLGLVEFREDHTEPPFRKSHLKPVPEELEGEEESEETEEEASESKDLGLQVMGSCIYKQSQVTIKLFKQIMGKVKFNNPKDHVVLARLFNYVTNANPEAIFLDAFAGSGTTGHSVLSLNKADGGKRRFILVESDDEYADAVTAERLRRVINGAPKAKDEELKKGLAGSFSYFELGNPVSLEGLLKGDKLPSFLDLAAYIFLTSTGEQFTAKAVNKGTKFIGSSARFDVYLFYEPDLDYLKKTALNLDVAKALPKGSGKRRLVFAPTKYLDSIHLDEYRIEFCQLPFEIYKPLKPAKA